MRTQTNEAQIILTIEAITSSQNLSRRVTAMLYNVPEVTLHTKMNGATPIAERRLANQLLTEIEVEVVFEYILDTNLRGYPSLTGNVEVMVNHILASRRARHVGKQWPYRFVQRREELKTRFLALRLPKGPPRRP